MPDLPKAIIKTYQWIDCPNCLRRKHGCQSCNRKENANPGFIRIPIK